jgi:hypothetical protein
MLARRKCWCENCKTEFNFNDGAWDDDNCPVCGNDNPEYVLIPIPDWETISQRKKRTGKPVGNKTAVWVKCLNAVEEDGDTCEDCLNCNFGEFSGSWVATDLSGYNYETCGCEECTAIIVIADPSTPPPDGWVPK